jgi:Trk K+ transport system NAD-binding subunit
VVGLALRKLDLPPNSLIAALWRAGEAMVPDGNTVLAAGDQVFAVTLKDHESQLRAMLAGG